MNRNSNITGNFSNGKSLKPGDSALNSRKVMGGDNFGNRNLNSNTNSNFNMRNNNTGINNNNIKYKFDENEMNEAKESVKLLKLKFGGGVSIKTDMNRNMGGGVMNTQGMSSNTNTNNNGNYRKPFKPNFGNGDSEPIPVETNKRVMVGKTNQLGNNNNFNNNNKYGNSSVPKTTTNSNKRPVIAEVEDNRPIAKEEIDFNNVEVEDQPDDDDDGQRIQCESCGRKFREDAYEKHSKICKKVFASKRKSFDVKKQRIIDSEHAMMLKHKEFEDKKKSKMGGNIKESNLSKKARWKKQSEEFRAILKANNTTENFGPNVANTIGGVGKTNTNMKAGIKTGTNYNQRGGSTGYTHTPSVITEDYLHCNMCNRRYNEQAYSKHLPTCERRTKEANIKNKNSSKTGNVITNVNGTYSGSKPNLNVKFGRK